MEKDSLNSISSINGSGQIQNGEEVEKNDDIGTDEKSTPSFREKLKDPVFKQKFAYSMYMAAGYFTLGMYRGQHGPAFLDIQIITDTDIKTASTFFIAGSIGYLIGCVITGFIYSSKMNKALLIFIATFGHGGLNIVMPYCAKYELMMIVRFIGSACSSVIETGLSTEHMRIWGSDGNGLLQLLHCCFSVGACISPLIAEPFLAEKVNYNTINATIGNGSDYSNATDYNYLRPTETRVKYLFLIVGLCSIISSLPFLVVFFRDRGKSKPAQKVVKRKFSRKGVPMSLLLIMLFWICIFYFVYCCVEDIFFSFLMVFLVRGYDSISKTRGASVVAISWAVLSVSRFFLIFMTKIVSTVPLLFLMTISMAVAYSLLTTFAYFGMVNALIVCSAISAMSCSGVFPAGFSWMETEMFQVTGMVSSCILVASSLASVVNPPILGYLMEDVNNMWFCYFLVMNTFLLLILMIALFLFCRCYIDKKYGTLASSLEPDDSTVTIPLKKRNNNDDDDCHATT